MWFPFRQRTGRKRRRSTAVVERLEARELLAVTPLMDTEVAAILDRAAAASSSEDAIIAVVDRGGRILGVRVEQGILDFLDAPANGGDNSGAVDTVGEVEKLVYAIDGAVAKARTAAFFANGTIDARINPETGADPVGNQITAGPLTSRTVRFISQSTVTQREVESNPNETADLTKRGPGFVAPIGMGGHFPPAIAHTPQVDLFGIEHTNRDSIVHPGEDLIKGTLDDIDLRTEFADARGRFNVPLAFVPVGKELTPPESYGFQSERMLDAQSRGIATLPGGIPIYPSSARAGDFGLLGGIGVFFPGTDDIDQFGDATFEQGFVAGTKQSEAARTNAPKVLEAEWIAFAAIGGSSKAKATVGAIEDAGGDTLAAVPFDYPFGRIDLVGIALELIGPAPGLKGVKKILSVGRNVGVGDKDSGDNQPVNAGLDLTIDGVEVAEGWLVTPHDSPLGTITAAEVEQIIDQGIAEANTVRAAIRLQVKGGDTVPGARTRMVFAVSDEAGNMLGLYRMHDATVFSIDVAVAKARNTAYYASANLQTPDQVDDNNNGADLPIGVAFTNRTFRFLAEPRYPQGVEGSRQGDFSILNETDGGGAPLFQTEFLKSKKPKNQNRAVENATLIPASSALFSTVVGFDAFNPGTNFREGDFIRTLFPDFTTDDFKHRFANQNGIVFFPGSAPIYNEATATLIGGFGVSGDGVDQDDVVTFSGAEGFRTPDDLRADRFKVRGTRLPYQKFNRNPRG